MRDKWRMDYTFEGADSSPRGFETYYPTATPEMVIRKQMEAAIRSFYPRQNNETLTLRRIQENTRAQDGERLVEERVDEGSDSKPHRKPRKAAAPKGDRVRR